jgi:hypothetical protein
VIAPDFDRLARTPCPIACCASSGTRLFNSDLARSCSTKAGWVSANAVGATSFHGVMSPRFTAATNNRSAWRFRRPLMRKAAWMRERWSRIADPFRTPTACSSALRRPDHNYKHRSVRVGQRAHRRRRPESPRFAETMRPKRLRFRSDALSNDDHA